jgi:hypothetical protein
MPGEPSGNGFGRKGLATSTVIVGVLALALVAPPPAAAQDSLTTVRAPGVTVNPTWCLPDVGVQGEIFGNFFYVCLFLDNDPPSYVVDNFPRHPFHVNTQECPNNQTGFIAEVEEFRIGACAIYEVRQPDPDPFIGGDIKVEDCEFENEQEGADPTVQLEGGGAFVCVRPVFEPAPPNVNATAEPCDRAKSFDPKVTIGDGGVQFCINYFLFGVAPDLDMPDRPTRGDAIRVLP